MEVLRLPMLALSKSVSPSEFGVRVSFPAASDFLMVPFPIAVLVAAAVVAVMISRACFDDDILLRHVCTLLYLEALR